MCMIQQSNIIGQKDPFFTLFFYFPHPQYLIYMIVARVFPCFLAKSTNEHLSQPLHSTSAAFWCTSLPTNPHSLTHSILLYLSLYLPISTHSLPTTSSTSLQFSIFSFVFSPSYHSYYFLLHPSPSTLIILDTARQYGSPHIRPQ